MGLAHRRLAIIDLSAAGHQPMHDSTGELCIVFNGEIYNFTDLREELAAGGHVFRSRTDTEVILAAYRQWGADCVTRFNGMFAFALYDARSRVVFMARDRAGEKPLFYALDDGTLRFASELKGLMADPRFPRRIDAEALDCYLAMGFIPGERCILRGREKAAARACIALQRGNRRDEGLALLGPAAARRGGRQRPGARSRSDRGTRGAPRRRRAPPARGGCSCRRPVERRRRFEPDHGDGGAQRAGGEDVYRQFPGARLL